MKIRLKGQYASARAAEESPASSTQQNGRRSQKQAEADVEEQQPDGEEDNVDEEGQQEGGSTSVSSEADEDYLNAPLNDLPESSGDEYYAPPSASTRPRGRPLGSKNRRRSTRESESPDVGRPVRSKRTSISSVPAERPSVSHPRRSAAAASPAIAHTSTAKRGRGRPPGSLNKKGKKGKARSESVNDDEEDEDSAADIDDPDDSAMLDEDEEASTSIVQSGQSTPSGRVVYGADGRRRGGAVGTSRMKAVKGQKYELANDELALPVDPKGEEKVDAMGRLQGGREYKGFTFSSPSRPQPERLYMLAIDAARCAGFRDSLYFFRRNPWLHKINCSQEEKEFLIEKGRLHQNLRSRQVTIVTARNLYKVFGARFVKNGRYVIDDYYETAAIAKGYKPGAPAYNEIYDPERDNTTLAMPKVGSFAKSKSEGRPAYMRMEKAFEMLHRGMPVHDRDDIGTPDVDNYASYEERERERNKKRKEEEGDSTEDEFGNRRRTKKRPSAFTTLALPPTYRPTDYGLVTHPSYQSLVAGAQFGGNGQPPFGEQWERSKARKPAPFLNGFNWMYEFARFTSKETNRAIMGIRKEFNAYHRITLGVPELSLTPQQVDEEQEGIWDISDEEHADEYESLDQFRFREGLDDAPVVGPDGEVDDRKRGRSPSPRLRNGASEPRVKGEEETGDMEMDDTKETKPKGSIQNTKLRRRRRRSPLRGFYDAHTRLPQLKLDTQPGEVLKWEQVALEPSISEPPMDPHLANEAARKGIASVEYLMTASHS